MLKKINIHYFSTLLSHENAVIYTYKQFELTSRFYCIKLMHSKESNICNSNKRHLKDLELYCLPIGQRPIALLDSSKSINIKSISTAATVYLISTALQNCKNKCLYSVLPGKLEVIMFIALLNWYKSYVLFHCHNIDHSNSNNR